MEYRSSRIFKSRGKARRGQNCPLKHARIRRSIAPPVQSIRISIVGESLNSVRNGVVVDRAVRQHATRKTEDHQRPRSPSDREGRSADPGGNARPFPPRRARLGSRRGPSDKMPRGRRARAIRQWSPPPPGARLPREWQKGLTAFRRPFKPPRRGPTPDRKRRSAERSNRPAGYRLTSLGTARPSSSRAMDCACFVDLSRLPPPEKAHMRRAPSSPVRANFSGSLHLERKVVSRKLSLQRPTDRLT